MESTRKRLMIVDISSFIFRAFFAIRPLHAPNGTPVNAVYGVLSMLLKIFQVYKPTHVLMAKDTSGGSFRNELYDQYKANRSEAPEELVPQFALIDELLDRLKLPLSLDEKYEADDIIGTACVKWRDDFDEILIASGDKDLMQFVNGKVKMVDTMKDKIYDPEGVFKKMGVHPEQIVDYLSLVGDSSDNIPGMKGVGAKGAAQLLEEYKTLDACIENKDKLKGKRLINAFENHLDDALLSRKLIEIVTDVDLKLEPEQTEYKLESSDELIKFLEELGFNNIIKRIKGQHVNKSSGKPAKTSKASAENSKKTKVSKPSSESSDQEFAKLQSQFSFETNLKEVSSHYISDEESFNLMMKEVEKASELALYCLYTKEEDIFTRRVGLMGIGLEQKVYVIPFKLSEGDVFNKSHLFQVLETTWSDSKKRIISYDIKTDMTHADTIGVEFKAKSFDLTQAHFVCDPSSRHDMATIIQSLTGEDLIVTDKKEDLLVSTAEKDRQLEVVSSRVGQMLGMAESMEKKLEETDLAKIYHEIDGPLLTVLAQMERQGIRIDSEFFKGLEKELQEKLDRIQDEVNKLGHESVNLNSPKQVGELLFTTLELPIIKKTKTGVSTDSEVLEELIARDLSPIPEMVLQYREIGKLLSTYVKALPELVNPTSKRLHTSFNQHIAQTGRLSSTHPNLQNIPFRTEMGRKIRRGFVADKDKLLLGADYSQVELRILAHFSEDPTMLKAFKDGLDIHAQTASEVLGVKLDEVTPEQRSKAKAVNFGLMYGQSSFGLAKSLRISRREAKDYIDAYFARFKNIKAFLDGLKEEAEKNGYCITMAGRKRFLPDIHSQNRTIKANAERVAINSPIQGTAADILKLAMLRIDKEIQSAGLQAKMLLQVHDELIFEFPKEEREELEKLVRKGMEDIVDLKVPLTVDIAVADNWYDLK